MADLLDIAPSTAVEVVKIDGNRIIVRGLHGDAIASIVARYPKLGMMLAGGGADIGTLGQFGAATSAIIAAGCGHLGDERYEQHAAALLAEDQLNLVQAIISLTFPNGLTSFANRLATLVTRADEGEKNKPIKVRLRKSPSPSPPLSDEASRPTMQ
jgi:hypothetical protein